MNHGPCPEPTSQVPFGVLLHDTRFPYSTVAHMLQLLGCGFVGWHCERVNSNGHRDWHIRRAPVRVRMAIGSKRGRRRRPMPVQPSLRAAASASAFVG